LISDWIKRSETKDWKITEKKRNFEIETWSDGSFRSRRRWKEKHRETIRDHEKETRRKVKVNSGKDNSPKTENWKRGASKSRWKLLWKTILKTLRLGIIGEKLSWFHHQAKIRKEELIETILGNVKTLRLKVFAGSWVTHNVMKISRGVKDIWKREEEARSYV